MAAAARGVLRATVRRHALGLGRGEPRRVRWDPRGLGTGPRARRGGGTRRFPEQDHRWLTGMFDRVGLLRPADIDGTIRDSRAHVMAHIDCAYPDAAPAMHAMKANGVTLHLASGGTSGELEPYMRRMGVWELIDRPYGVDLLGAAKQS